MDKTYRIEADKNGVYINVDGKIARPLVNAGNSNLGGHSNRFRSNVESIEQLIVQWNGRTKFFHTEVVQARVRQSTTQVIVSAYNSEDDDRREMWFVQYPENGNFLKG